MSLRILTASHVDGIISSLSPELALSTQAHVFKAFSASHTCTHPSTSSSTDSSPGPGPGPGPGSGPEGIQTPQRITTSSHGSTVLYMPSRAPTLSTSLSSSTSAVPTFSTSTSTTCKIVSVPTASDNGLPASTLVLDDESGAVKAVINARKLTALRNACGSALFLRAFPLRDPPKHMITFGSGAQILAHAKLILSLYPSISTLDVVVRRFTSRSQSLVGTLLSLHPCVTIAEHALAPDSPELQELLSTANVVVTATSTTAPLFRTTATVPPRDSRVIMIGSYKPHMREVDSHLVARARSTQGREGARSGVIVDSREACAAEAGELIDAAVKAEEMRELGEVLLEQEQDKDKDKGNGTEGEAYPGEEEDLIMFKSVGIGIQDTAISQLVLDEAERRGLGTVVEAYD